MKKQCSKCGEWKELTVKFWHKNKYKFSGFNGQCKNCRNDYGRRHPESKHKWVKNNKEKRKKSCKEFRLRNLNTCNQYRINYRKESDVNKNWCAKNTQTLGTSYVKYLLRCMGIKGEIAPEMIQIKHEQIMVYRALKQLKEAINE